MTAKDINDIINVICQNDEDFEKACISPAYLKKELEALALEQEPCEDAVSRQAVLEVLKNNRYRFNISQEGYCEGKVLWSENLIKDDACKEIEQLPSVTPTTCIAKVTFDKDELQKIVDEKVKEMVVERKKGKWERGYSFPDGEYVKCTVCGEIIKCIYPMHYCPNCGAEMESGE